MSQTKLAELAGLRQSDVSAFEIGRLNPRPYEIERLAAALGVSPPSILMRPVRVVLEEVEQA